MDISKAVRNIRPLSKHLLYEFGFYEGSPALCIDVISMNIDLLKCLPFPDSTHEVCNIRGSVQGKKSHQYLIVIDRDKYDIVLFEREAYNNMDPVTAVTKSPISERAKEPYHIDVAKDQANYYGECTELQLKCMTLIDKIPNIQSLTSEGVFSDHVKRWIHEYVLPYILRKDNKDGDDND